MAFVNENETVGFHSMVFGRVRGTNMPVLVVCTNRQFNHPMFSYRDKKLSWMGSIFNRNDNNDNYYVYTVEYPEERGLIRFINNGSLMIFDRLEVNYYENDVGTINNFDRKYYLSHYQADNKYRPNYYWWSVDRSKGIYTYSLSKFWNIEVTHYNDSVDWWLPYTHTPNGIEYGGSYPSILDEPLLDLTQIYNKFFELSEDMSLGHFYHRAKDECNFYWSKEYLNHLVKLIKDPFILRLHLAPELFGMGSYHDSTFYPKQNKFDSKYSEITNKISGNIVKYEIIIRNTVSFKYDKPYSHPKRIPIILGNSGVSGEDNYEELDYGIFIKSSNINVDKSGTTVLNNAKIRGSALFNDLRVDVPRRVYFNFVDSNGTKTSYYGEWDLSEDLVINAGCQGNCSGSCTGTCTGGCSGTCSGSCSGGCSSSCSGVGSGGC